MVRSPPRPLRSCREMRMSRPKTRDDRSPAPGGHSERRAPSNNRPRAHRGADCCRRSGGSRWRRSGCVDAARHEHRRTVRATPPAPRAPAAHGALGQSFESSRAPTRPGQAAPHPRPSRHSGPAFTPPSRWTSRQPGGVGQRGFGGRPRRDRGDQVERAEREQYYAKPHGSGSGARDKAPDPNSPFAKLAALKQDLVPARTRDRLALKQLALPRRKAPALEARRPIILRERGAFARMTGAPAHRQMAAGTRASRCAPGPMRRPWSKQGMLASTAQRGHGSGTYAPRRRRASPWRWTARCG